MKSLHLKPVFLIFYVLLSISLAACSREPIKIGLMVDLTGRASELGISCRNGAEIAVEKINRNGGIKGRNLQLIVKDDRGLPEEAVKVDRELIQENIEVGLGHIASGSGIAGLKVFSEAGKLMLSPTISTESLTGIDDNFIRIIGSNRKQGEVLAKKALKNKKANGVALVYEYNNSAYASEVCKYFERVYSEGGGKILLEDSFVSKPGMNFDEIAQKVLKTGADGALIVAGGMDLAIIAQKIRTVKPDMEIYAGMWAMTGDLLANGGRLAEGINLPGVYDSKNDRPEFISFKNDYYKRFNVEPTFASVYAYESVMVLSEALKRAKKHDAGSIKKAIIDIGKFKGIQDDFVIDGFGDTDRDYFLFTVKEAAFQREK